MYIDSSHTFVDRCLHPGLKFNYADPHSKLDHVQTHHKRLMMNVCFFQETFQNLKGGQEEDKPGVGLLYNRRSGPD